MIFSYKLLKSLVDINDLSIDELVNKLTFSGFEVEGYKKVAQASDVTCGEVISCEPHPDSDHLHVLKVNIGTDILDVVCGAKNVFKGARVILAKVGCKLPAINETIKKGVIRGKVSNGMCCSLVELGVDKASLSEEDLNGIHLLSKDIPLGCNDLLERLNLDDYSIDINILPNRPDCLSHLGLAREISSLFNRKLLNLDSFNLTNKESSYFISSLTDKCDKFLFSEVTLNQESKTPNEIVQFLQTCGQRSVSLLVDLGNFFTILTGQPIHLYDLDKVEGKKLVVVDDFNGPFVALNDNSYNLKNGDIVIRDEKKACCLAGVMGGKDVAISSNSSHIGIEVAHFYHASIRHTSNNLGLSSFSSSLFVKGVNPYLLEENLSYFLALLKKYVNDFVYLGTSKFDKVKPLTGGFDFSLEKLNHRLGASYSKEEVFDLLKRFNLTYENGKILFNKYRLDLVEQCDIDEEVFRSLKQDPINISLKDLPITIGSLTYEQKTIREIKNNLIAHDLNQIITFTLVSKKLDNELRVFNNNESYKLLNPLTEEHEYVRSDLLSSLVQAINYNLDRKEDNFGLFEVSTIDTKQGNHIYLSLGLVGKKLNRELVNAEDYNFYDLKGLVEEIFALCNLDEKRYMLVRSKNENFHPYKSADIFIGKTLVGTFGYLNPKLKIGELLVGELDLGFMLSQKSSKFKAKPLSSLQPIRRDLAFKLNGDVSSSQIISEIKKAGGNKISKIQTFDVFNKDNVTSYAYAIYLVNEEKSFTDDEINQILDKIIKQVTGKLKVELR